MKSEQIEKHQPTRKWGSSKYSSREMPRYSEEEKKKMGIITGKLRPKPEQENKQLKDSNEVLKQKLEKIEDRLKDVPMMITYEELPNVLKEILQEK